MSGSASDPSYLGVSIDPFSVAVRQWVIKANGNADAVYRAIILAFLSRVKELTPVKTGNLRASWTVVAAGDGITVTGSDAATDPESTIASLHYGDNVLIVNPAKYARRIEFGFVGRDSLGRHYDEKGRHMLAQTVAELPTIAQQATQAVIGNGG